MNTLTHDEALALIALYSDEGPRAGIADELLDEAFALLANDKG
jgi:hypothetical protein